MKEGKFNFEGILGKSIREYRDNFRDIFKFIFLFVGIPSLLLVLIQIVLLIVKPDLFTMMSTPASLIELDAGTLKLPLYFQIVSYFFTLVAIFLGIFVSAGLISTSLKKDKFSFKELVRNAKPRYWKYFGFCIVVLIFILLLSLLLIIPGIIFGIYWAFAAYVFFDRKKKIRASLKQSREIVKGRWWKTLGYLFLFGLIVILFAILVGIIVSIPTLLITTLYLVNHTSLSLTLLIVSSLLSFISGFILNLVTTPLGILFLKNFYMKMKK
ncbi:MAG: hypothetical protein NTZ83_05330 [Candidatus Pacearchaeota archaeon]|nr:hypothetical protein [Candidatus Pacearchaeota archaeon]